MIKNGIDIGREHGIIVVIHNNSRIGPPQKSLWQCCPIIHLNLDFQIRFVGMQSKSLHGLHPKHTLDFVAPNRNTSIAVVFD
ncbi:hypothetical protein D3C81_1538420 [compost metagenome]